MDTERVLCPACGQPNPQGKRFCGDCGAALPTPCPACGAANPPDKRFCGDCGATLTPAAVSTRPAASATTPATDLQGQVGAFRRALPPSMHEQVFTQEQGENRLLTILFADLSGSTAAIGALAPEDAAALLQEVLQAMVEAIVAHGGRINQVLGDAVLAFFGTPQAHENDPERAIRAALQIREAVQGRGLNATVGINSGEVYLGELGRGPQQEVRAVGSTVNLAARLQQKAQPGQILVGESVYRQTHRAFTFARHEVEAKGFSEPIAAYEVLRALPRPEKVRGIEGLRADLIGREKELAGIADALAAVRAGRGQIVTLIGEAGVGKSRLIAELKERAMAPAPDQPEPLWLEGRCLDVGMAVSYWPFLDLLRAHFAFLPEDNDRARGARISSAIEALVDRGDLPAGRAEEMLPLLGHLLGARFGSDLDERLTAASPEQIKHQTFLALVDLLVALARPQPLILVLEDLHWADSLSLDLVSLLMESLRLAPLLLVCVYRPEEEHKCWHLGAIATRKCYERFTEIPLKELTAAQSRRLVESLLHIEALPDPVKEQILGRAQGNPFFVEEVVRSLLDADLVYHDGAVWRARAEIAAVAVPESIQGVILSRVDRLEAETRHVLQSAAVIGRLFRRRLLEHLAQQEVELDRALAELEDRQLIYAERAIPEEEYSFHHVLAQETVYHNILRRRRVEFHRQVAEAMEQLYGDNLEEYYEQLAYHYAQGGIEDKALLYRELAGDKAQAHYANATAEGYYWDVVERLDTLGQVQDAARIRVKLGAVLTTVARYEDALAVLEQAGEAYRAAGDQEGLARSLAHIGWVYTFRGAPDEGIARLQSGLESLTTSSMSPGLAEVYLTLAPLFSISGRYGECLAVAERAYALAQALGDERLLGRAAFLCGLGLHHIGQAEAALRHREEAMRYSEKVGDVFCLSITLGDQAEELYRQGEFEQSWGYNARALALAERRGDQAWMAYVLFNRGHIAFFRGDWGQARSDAEQALASFRQIRDSWGTAYALYLLGRLGLAEGHWDEATRYLDEAASWAGQRGDLQGLRWIGGARAERDLLEGRPAAALATLEPLLDRPGFQENDVIPLVPLVAWAHLELGQTTAAEDIVAQAIARAMGQKYRPALVLALRILAMLAMRQGRWTDAEQALEEGLAATRTMSYPYAEAHLQRLQGEMHVHKGDREAARQHLEAALAIYQRLGARKDSEQVEGLLAGL
jgi:class 3 adenylate cyclase/tetratricopeptide (TPR) repeat protein